MEDWLGGGAEGGRGGLGIKAPPHHCPAFLPASPSPPHPARDAAAIQQFVSSEGVDVLTIEIEHIDVDAIEAAAKLAGVDLEPTPSTIRVGIGDGGEGCCSIKRQGGKVSREERERERERETYAGTG